MVKSTTHSESQWIEQIRRMAGAPRGAGIVLGIGDDCAIFRPPGAREDLVFTTDLLVEDVHFRRTTHKSADVGWKALARGLSDIASMGAEPRFCLLSLALAAWADTRWLNGFYRGLLQLATRASAPLIGGDLGHSAVTTCDIVVCGAVPRGQALRRDRARAGDAIYVSGRLGGSALGLATRKGAAWKRHLRPEPRLALGRFLRRSVKATAAMDLSDGLSIDLRRICIGSNLSAAITVPPSVPGATIDQALHGGEDYELLFTASPRTRVPPHFEGIPLTRIGVMRSGRPGEIRLDDIPLPPLGYDHFRTP